jgi:hypothetical protein
LKKSGKIVREKNSTGEKSTGIKVWVNKITGKKYREKPGKIVRKKYTGKKGRKKKYEKTS